MNWLKRWRDYRLIGVPWIRFGWKTLDFRPWYYVWIDGEKCDWWALEYELDELRAENKNIRFERIPWYKTFH